MCMGQHRGTTHSTNDEGLGENVRLDAVESFLHEQLIDTSSLAYLLDSDRSEDYLELCFSVEAAKLIYRGDRESQIAALVISNLGEHLCVRSYLAPGKRAQVVVQRDDAILTEEQRKSLNIIGQMYSRPSI